MLGRLELAELKEIALRRGWKIKASDRADLVDVLAPRLEDPTEIARAVTCLPEQLQAALRVCLIAEDGSGITASTLADTLTALDLPRKPVEAAGLLLDLSHHGLLMPLHDSPDGEARYLFPWEIQRNLPPLPGWCRQSREPSCSSTRTADVADWLADVIRVWEHLRAQPPRLRDSIKSGQFEQRMHSAGRPWARSLRRERLRNAAGLAPSLLDPPPFLLDDDGVSALQQFVGGDPERLELVCRLLCELDLVTCESGYLLPRPEVMNHFQRSSILARHVVVTQAYVSLVDWNEIDVLLRADARLALMSDLPCALAEHETRPQLAHLHQMLLRLVATAGEEGWCDMQDVTTALRRLWQRFADNERSDNQPWPAQVWRLAWRQDKRQLNIDDDSDWSSAHSKLLRVMLEGPLYWLGLVELAYQNDQLVAFHTHGLLDRMWDHFRGVEYTDYDGPALMVDTANLTITVRSGAITPQAHALLGRIARLEETTPFEFIYRLDQHTAYTTFEQGSGLEDLLNGWKELLPVEAPDTLKRALADWWSQYGQIHLYEGLALLELGDDFTLRELEASTALGKHVVARLSSRLVLVPDKAVPQLLHEFAAKGLMPREVK